MSEENKTNIADENAQPPPLKEVPPQEVKSETQTIQALMPIMVNEKGIVQAKDNSELLRYCGAMISSAMVPERFTKPTELFGALMFVRSVGLPDNAIRQVAVIHGTPSFFGDLPLALVQKTNKLKKFKEIWFDKDYNEIRFENKNLNAEAYGAVCFAAREDDEFQDLDTQSFAFTLDDGRKAGLYPCQNPNKPWAKYTKMMLRYRARSIMLKSLFADLINGIAIAEYDYDVLGTTEMRNVTPENDANELKDAFVKDNAAAANGA